MKPVKISQCYAFMLVQYPYRKTPDLYVALEDKPVFCAQCDTTFPIKDFPEHIKKHDRRLKK